MYFLLASNVPQLKCAGVEWWDLYGPGLEISWGGKVQGSKWINPLSTDTSALMAEIVRLLILIAICFRYSAVSYMVN